MAIHTYTTNDFEKYLGKIITIEGSDGSGKETQTLLLRDFLMSLGFPVYTSGYPQYLRTAAGLFLARFLRKTDLWSQFIPEIEPFYLNPDMIKPLYEKLRRDGFSEPIAHFMSKERFGVREFLLDLFKDYEDKNVIAHNDGIAYPMYVPPKEVPPLLVAVPYAIDRAEFTKHIRNALESSYIVLLDRYWTSNLGHQVGKIKRIHLNGTMDINGTINEKKRLIQDLIDIELRGFRIPVESVVINLSVSTKNAQKLIENRKTVTDVLEGDHNYILNSVNNYEWLVSQFEHWRTINCQNENGLKNIEDIHKMVLEELVDFDLLERVYPDYL